MAPRVERGSTATRRSESGSTASISTASSRRSRPCSTTSIEVDPEAARARAPALRLPDPLGRGSRGLWPRGGQAVGTASARSEVVAHAARHDEPSARLRRSTTASAFWMPSRTRGWWRTPSATTASCTTAQTSRGICAISTCSRRWKLLLRVPRARGSRPSSGSTTRISATRPPPRWAPAASSTSATLPASDSAGSAYLIGFGTDHGTVAAAHNWDEPMRGHAGPAGSRAESYERLFHDSRRPAFSLQLARPRPRPRCATNCAASRLERAIGVVYRPETELQSHYFHAVLPRPVRRVHLVRSRRSAVRALARRSRARRCRDTYPFAC